MFLNRRAEVDRQLATTAPCGLLAETSPWVESNEAATVLHPKGIE
jgi:hypothetical protein